MAETFLTYNGVVLRNVLTRSFNQEASYDPSGTDLLYYRFTIAVTGYCTVGYASTVGGTTYPRVGISPDGYSTAAAQHVAIRSLLGKPRQSFELRMGADDDGTGGYVILAADPMGRGSILDQSDLNNGPKPKNIKINHVVAGQTLEIEFEIEICVLECGGQVTGLGNTSGVLSNRWSVADTIDQNFFTTRTFTGRLRTATALSNPMGLRSWVVPRLELGFKRQTMTYRVTEDGLNLEYTIIDKEVAFSPPRPATEWSYRYTESAGDGKTILSSIDLMLGTSRAVDKKVLFRIAYSIIQSRLFERKIDESNGILLSLEMTDEYSEGTNRIYASAKVQRHKAFARDELRIGVAVANLGRPIDTFDILAADTVLYDSDRSYGSNPGEPIYVRGPISTVAAWSAYLQDPCDNDHRMVASEAAVASDVATLSDDEGSDAEIDAKIVSELPGDPIGYTSAEHEAAIYTHFTLQNRYLANSHRVQLPRAIQRPLYASGLPTSTVVGVGGETWKRRINVEAERIGVAPKFPVAADCYDFDAGQAVLLNHSVIVDTPDRTPDGKLIHRAKAEYTYAITAPPVSQSLPIGTNPWEDPAFAAWVTDANMLTGAAP